MATEVNICSTDVGGAEQTNNEHNANSKESKPEMVNSNQIPTLEHTNLDQTPTEGTEPKPVSYEAAVAYGDGPSINDDKKAMANSSDDNNPAGDRSNVDDDIVDKHTPNSKEPPVNDSSTVNDVDRPAPVDVPVHPPTPRFVYVLSILAAMGGFLLGYDIGIVAGSMLFIQPHFEVR